MKKDINILNINFIGSIILVFFMLFEFTGCTKKEDQITLKVGAQNYAEVIIMAYMAEALIEAETDYEVEVVSRLASAVVLDQAMQTGEVDIASLFFTGGATGLLHPKINPLVEDIRDPKWRDAEIVFDFVKFESEKILNRRWLEPLGYENTYAITVKRETADKFDLQKISDLGKVSEELSIGMDDAYMDREVDGYYPLLSAYDLKPFKDTVSMQINLLYQALRDDQVDVGVAYSSDARIHAYDLVWLEDDLNFFPPFEAAYVINLSVLEKAPEIETILSKLSGQIDIDTIQQLNYEVDINHMEHKDVAIQYLKENGFIK